MKHESGKEKKKKMDNEKREKRNTRNREREMGNRTARKGGEVESGCGDGR